MHTGHVTVGARLLSASCRREFCSLLGLCRHGHGRVAVVGYSAGTPWAATLAAQCGPGLLAGVALVAPIGPPDTPHKHQGMALLFRVSSNSCSGSVRATYRSSCSYGIDESRGSSSGQGCQRGVGS